MRTRILVGTILLTTVTIAAFFVPAAVALDDAEREAQELELQREAADAAALLGAREEERERDGGDDEPDDDEDREDDDGRTGPIGAGEDHTFGLYQPSGDLVLGAGPDRADAPVVSALGGRTATARVGSERVAAVPLASGGALRAAEPVEEADERARAAILRLAAAACGVVGLAAVAAWLLARRLGRPLGDLSAAATRIGGGDFTATAPTTGLPEVDEVADALNAGAARIGALVERERRLTADTSHQLRTPLAGLRLAMEAELAAPRPDPTIVLEEALGALDRMEATVVALTDLARDERPATTLSLDDLAMAADARWRSIYVAAGRALRADATSRATVAARPAALDTILDVLLDNALHHGRGEVVIATEAVGGRARLVVVDEGTCDLPDDVLFARRRSGAESTGTGIGLDLARSLADAEGARLRLVDPTPTTFQLLLATT